MAQFGRITVDTVVNGGSFMSVRDLHNGASNEVKDVEGDLFTIWRINGLDVPSGQGWQAGKDSLPFGRHLGKVGD